MYQAVHAGRRISLIFYSDLRYPRSDLPQTHKAIFAETDAS